MLGAGPAGLTAAVALERSGQVDVRVIERAGAVGGMTRTIVDGDFRFDLGGHRFYTKVPEVEEFVRGLLGDDLLEVSRLSRIHFRGRYVDYPVRPWNALRMVGPWTAAKIAKDLTGLSSRRPPTEPLRSLEDWMVASYGRTLFETYFKVYAEKVWGMPANEICADLAAQRVQGLDLWKTLRNALFPRSAPAADSLVERFLYPRLGYGQICEAMERELSSDALSLESEPTRITHDGRRITGLDIADVKAGRAEPGGVGMGRVDAGHLKPDHLISTIPLPRLVELLDPAPPEPVLSAARALGFRAVVFVAVFIDRPSVRPESWIYFPSPQISFGRIVEPRNWSAALAPEGQTSIVAEHFCDPGDEVYCGDDSALIDRTVRDLSDELGFIERDAVLGARVIRVPHAYPRMDVTHKQHVAKLTAYLDRFENLQVVGRAGMYRYHNTDHVIETGLAAAARLLGDHTVDPWTVNTELTYHERKQNACSRVSS